MSVEGRCNCGSIRVVLKEAPTDSLLCYCTNCRRAGGGLGSVNYVPKKADTEITDPNSALKEYHDSNTKSGNTIIRRFCSNCGSPVITDFSAEAPQWIVKASLFDDIPKATGEVYKETKVPWAKVLDRENL